MNDQDEIKRPLNTKQSRLSAWLSDLDYEIELILCTVYWIQWCFSRSSLTFISLPHFSPSIITSECTFLHGREFDLAKHPHPSKKAFIITLLSAYPKNSNRNGVAKIRQSDSCPDLYNRYLAYQASIYRYLTYQCICEIVLRARRHWVAATSSLARTTNLDIQRSREKFTTNIFNLPFSYWYEFSTALEQ